MTDTPLPAASERELREIFIKLTRIDGKMDARNAEVSDMRLAVQRLTKRVEELEAFDTEARIEAARASGRSGVIRYIIDGGMAILVALVGAGVWFK